MNHYRCSRYFVGMPVPEICEAICTEYLIMKTIIEINQFQEGLNVLEIGDLIKAHPTLFQRLFFHDPKIFSVKDLDKLF